MTRARHDPSAGAKPSAGARRSAGAKPRRWVKRLVWALAIVLVVGAVLPLAIVQLTRAGRLYEVAEVPAHDVAIVYGAGLTTDGQPSLYLTGRLMVARDLYRAGKVKVILVSGDNLSVYHNEPKAMMDWLTAQGVPADKVVADYAGADTYSTCVRANRIFGVTSAILVSQTYHLPRAVATCRLVGVDAVGVGDDTPRTTDTKRWFSYQVREVLADYNLMLDLLTRRQPILGPYETGVDVALGRK